MLFAAAVSALSLFSVASAQVTVQVGSTAAAPGGIFQYIPSNFTASNGTVVTFKFTGAPGNHSVTQSTFADPCDPVAGGFDSGWVFVPPSPALAETPEWNLTITDDTKPIWFFCKQLLPTPHCSNGMVGSINAPATGNTFTAFQAAAKSFGKASGQSEGGLVGIGASASAGIGPIASGATAYPITASSGSASGSATGSASAPAGTATSPSTSGSPTTSPAASGANGLAANSLVAMFAAALGFVLA